MKKIILLILLTSCTTIAPVCRHSSIYSAITYSDLTKQPAGIAVGYWNGESTLHSQAFTVDSKYKLQWLALSNGEVAISKMDNFSPSGIYQIVEFESKYIRVREFTKEQIRELSRQLY